MTRGEPIRRITVAHLLLMLLVAGTAHAAGRVERKQLNQDKQASLRLGDSKCLRVGEVMKCVPIVVAST